MRPAPTPAGPEVPVAPSVEVLDVIVRLLSEMEAPTPSGEFYGRLCEALCLLTSMDRAALFVYDPAHHRVRAVGSHPVRIDGLEQVQTTLEAAPMAQRALTEDRVVEVTEGLEREIPAEYVDLLGLTTAVCTPLSAAGHWFGVIFADRGGRRFELTAPERYAMWMLGKTAALAASARIATRQQDRARRLAERLDLARDIHEGVMQRLFGVSLALSSQQELSSGERERCSDEITAALGDLRDALQRPLAPPAPEAGGSLREELDRLAPRYADLGITVSWDEGVTVPAALDPLAQSVLAEALRNARKHAQPTRLDVRVERVDHAFVLEIFNDGVRGGARGTAMGLRLAAFSALQQGGVVEFGAPTPDTWRVRLYVPLEAAA